jgi:hypothetical protein
VNIEDNIFPRVKTESKFDEFKNKGK